MRPELRLLLVQLGMAYLLQVAIDLGAVFAHAAQYDYWPSAAKIVSAVLSGSVAGLVAAKTTMSSAWADWKNGKGNGK